MLLRLVLLLLRLLLYVRMWVYDRRFGGEMEESCFAAL